LTGRNGVVDVSEDRSGDVFREGSVRGKGLHNFFDSDGFFSYSPSVVVGAVVMREVNPMLCELCQRIEKLTKYKRERSCNGKIEKRISFIHRKLIHLASSLT
jgi:hypothetical protein